MLRTAGVVCLDAACTDWHLWLSKPGGDVAGGTSDAARAVSLALHCLGERGAACGCSPRCAALASGDLRAWSDAIPPGGWFVFRSAHVRVEIRACGGRAGPGEYGG